MLPPIRFLKVTGRYNEPLLYRSNAEPAKLESSFFAASVDLGKSGRYILQSQRKVGSLQKRDINGSALSHWQILIAAGSYACSARAGNFRNCGSSCQVAGLLERAER